MTAGTDWPAEGASLAREVAVAERAARAAGAEIMRFYGETAWQSKGDASPVTRADHASNELIASILAAEFPHDARLSEESIDTADRLGASRVWIVDPLDGTKEFLAQNGEFSVLIGLVAEGRPVLGVVYLPATQVMYSATEGGGSWVQDPSGRRRLELGDALDEAGIRLVGSRSHSDPFLDQVRTALGITDVMPCGSVGVKCARIAEGQRDLYVHPVAHLKEWDTCAPEVILREAGGRVTDCRGVPLGYNKPNPVQPFGILAATPAVHERARGPVGRLYAEAFPVTADPTEPPPATAP